MRRLLADAWPLRELSYGWELAGTAPGEIERPGGLDQLAWHPAEVPGTVDGALAPDDPRLADLDAWDWWFRTMIEVGPGAADEEIVLWLDGLATIAEVWCDGERALDSDSMYAPHALTLGEGPARRELAICLRALSPLLQGRRKPRARWRTKLVSAPNLRFFRTMIIGRSPGLAAGPAVVGPYRTVALQRRRAIAVDDLRLRSSVAGAEGRVMLTARVRALGAGAAVESATLSVTGPGVEVSAELAVDERADGLILTGELAVDDPARWWPHTHGSPVLHDVWLRVRAQGSQEVTVQAGRIGFRDLRLARELEHEGLALSVNGVEIFARGAVWTPFPRDGTAAAEEARLREVLGHVVRAGMNMLRIPGIACPESSTFHDLCDELGILVWQDFLFANLDYPEQSPEFMDTVAAEGRTLLAQLAHRPSLAVLCGGSEVAQQVAMLGLDPALADGPLYGELLPQIVREAEVQAPYVPSAPWGGDLPFRPDRGVANYYGVGAYLRPLSDARLCKVKFSAECLAFANVPDAETLAESAPGGLGLGHPLWKRGVPRDADAGWDFEDVRDHYFRLLHRVDEVGMRYVDQERYLDISRDVSGEVMATTFGEWRRQASPNAGGLVLWLTDLRPGAGWGLLDHRGEPKVALHHLRRALAPVAVWGTDEGLGGVDIHVANDRPQRLEATLRVALYRDRMTLVGQAEQEIELPGHGATSFGLEALLGHFVDVTWAYRFGPPAQDLVALTLERGPEGARELISQAFLHPAGRPRDRARAVDLGLEADLDDGGGGAPVLRVGSRRLAYGVRVHVPGWRPSDDAFSVEPGHDRVIELLPAGDATAARGTLTALNLEGSLPIVLEAS